MDFKSKLYTMMQGKVKVKNIEGDFALAEYLLVENEDNSVSLEFSIPSLNIVLENKGANFFELLIKTRKQLLNFNLSILCNGASLNVYPSPMQFDMGLGYKATIRRLGMHSQLEDIVNIFEYNEDIFKECNIEQQQEFYNKWVLSKKKIEIKQQEISVVDVLEIEEFTFFWGHQTSKDNSVSKQCLSQWWPCEFIHDSILYGSAEQWMMAEKARIFADRESLEKILASNDPKEIKELGRKVQCFDEAVWNIRSYDVVYEGTCLKFSQNFALREFLLNTGETTIVEASPNDRIWGVGMSQDDSAIRDPLKWKGKNLLGFILMEVRNELRHQIIR